MLPIPWATLGLLLLGKSVSVSAFPLTSVCSAAEKGKYNSNQTRRVNAENEIQHQGTMHTLC